MEEAGSINIEGCMKMITNILEARKKEHKKGNKNYDKNGFYVGKDADEIKYSDWLKNPFKESEETVCDDCGEEDCSMDGLCCPEAIERTESEIVPICYSVGCNKPADWATLPGSYYHYKSKEFGDGGICGECYWDAGWCKDDENPDNKD